MQQIPILFLTAKARKLLMAQKSVYGNGGEETTRSGDGMAAALSVSNLVEHSTSLVQPSKDNTAIFGTSTEARTSNLSTTSRAKPSCATEPT